MCVIIQIEHVLVPRGNRLFGLHHRVVWVGGLTLINDGLSLLDSCLRPVLEFLLEPGLRILFSLEILLLGILDILFKCFIVNDIQNLIDIRLV